MKKRLNYCKGFTLVEMVVVIAIIAVLVTIAMPQVLRNIKNAQKQADIQTARHIAYAFFMWQQETGNPLDTIIHDVDLHVIDGTPIGGAGGLKLGDYLTTDLPRPKLNSSYWFYYRFDSVVVHIYAGDGSNRWELFPEPDPNYK